MKPPRYQEFDTRGFWFFTKFLCLVVVLIVSAKYGSEVAFSQLFPTEPAEASSPAEEVQSPQTAKQEARITKQEKAFLETRTIKGQSLETVVPDEGKFVGADLVNMKLLLYEDGEIIETIEILSKGRPGSHWETPSGVYEFKSKERSHFSSIGGVSMPYSMQFFGNFFIHGWPYYPGGKPVEEGYSGGCIRLSKAAAKKVFNFIDVGTGIFVYDHQEKSTTGELELASTPPPEVDARSYMIADLGTGQVFAEKNAEQKLPIASITKLMTAVVANETISFDTRVPILDSGVDRHPDASAINDKLLIGELLYPLLLESNNKVAHSLASHYGHERFLERMNEKASAYGMDDTRFADASGLSDENVSTAKDLFSMSRYLERNRSFLWNMTKQPSRKITSRSGEAYVFENQTHFLEDENYLGGKIGYTPAAQETMVALFEIEAGGQTHKTAIIVFGTEDRKQAVQKLLDWLKQSVGSKNSEFALEE